MITADMDKMVKLLERNARSKPAKKDSATELERLKKKLGELDRQVASLYEDKVSGAISGQAFSVLLRECEAERVAAAAELARLMDELDEAQARTANVLDWMALMTKHSEVRDIDRDLLAELVERIEVGGQESKNGEVIANLARSWYSCKLCRYGVYYIKVNDVFER